MAWGLQSAYRGTAMKNVTLFWTRFRLPRQARTTAMSNAIAGVVLGAGACPHEGLTPAKNARRNLLAGRVASVARDVGVADELKAFYDRARVARLADELVTVWPAFPRERFVRHAVGGLDALELMDRARQIAAALAEALPRSYPEALGIVMRTLEAPPTNAGGSSMEPFHWLPHSFFIADHGLAHFDLSLEAQRVLTRRMSCEFSIRAFLERDAARTLLTLAEWTHDPDEHVRRLVSEGARPRLPWAGRLRAFQADPSPVLALLEVLKDDPSEYVRRSVANNLNDISKDHPGVVLETCERWQEGASEERRRLVLHALRTLVRAGDPDAIRLSGGSAGGEFVTRVRVEPSRPKIGGSVRATVELRNAGKQAATAVLALRIHFVKARGATAARTFKLPTVTLAPGASQTLSKSVSLQQLTTRTHYPGAHGMELLVNGTPRRIDGFTLSPA